MRNSQPKFISNSLLGIELIVINLCIFICVDQQNDYFTLPHICAIFNISWLLVEWELGSYQTENLLKTDRILSSLFSSCSQHLMLCAFALYALNLNISQAFFIKYYLYFAAICFLFRFLFSEFLKSLDKDGYRYKNILIIGTGKEALTFKKLIESDKTFGIKIAGFIPHTKQKAKGKKLNILGPLNEFKEIAQKNNIHEVYWSGSLSSKKEIDNIIEFCDNSLIHFHVIPEYLNFPLRNSTVCSYDGIPVMHFRNEPLESALNGFIKRMFDIAFSTMVIVFILSWLMPILAILIKITSHGPVFFYQERTGRDNRTFNIIKFRTMTINGLADNKQATQNDSRITPLGRFLRNNSIDELPQFFNCLFGNMSVVGPRPHMIKHTEDYSQKVNHFMARHQVKSGLTGWAQANGARGETRTTEEMKKRIDYDIWYLENWSLWLDIKICLMTAHKMFSRDEKAY